MLPRKSLLKVFSERKFLMNAQVKGVHIAVEGATTTIALMTTTAAASIANSYTAAL